MNNATPQAAALDLFRLDSMEPAASPDGSEGPWFRYVIIQGSNVITGLRSGTHAELDPILRDMVERLNERAGKHQAKSRK